MKRKGILWKPVYALASWFGRNFPGAMIRIRYFIRFHRFPNLRNPRTLNEKIIWMSLKTDTGQWSRLTDKYAVREYVKSRGLSDILTGLYGVWSDASDIDFSKLPEGFVLKPTHGSGNVMIVDSKSGLDIDSAVRTLNGYLSTRYGELEGGRHYYRITPRVVAEELLINDEISARYSKSVIDYKIWCFNGKPHYIWTCCNRREGYAQVMTYDTDWTPHAEYSVFNSHYAEGAVVPRPKCLERMLEIAAILSEGFPVVRVDLYNVGDRVCFGEMTFTSLGGMMNFYTAEFLEKAGDMISLPTI